MSQGVRVSPSHVLVGLALAVLVAVGLTIYTHWQPDEQPEASPRGTDSSPPSIDEPPTLVGGAENRADFSLTVTSDDEEARWSLEAQAPSGWRILRDGVGSEVIVLEAVPQGMVWLHVEPERPDLLGAERVVMTTHPAGLNPDLRLRPAAHVVGTVRADGKVLAGVRVEIAAPPERQRLPWLQGRLPSPPRERHSSTDSHGTYRFPNLPLATYAFQARHSEYVGPIRRTIQARTPGETYRVDLEFTAGTRFSGQVLDAHGDPFAGVRLHVLREADPGRWEIDCWVEAGPDGRFLTPVLAPALAFDLQIATGADGELLVLQRQVPGPHEPRVDLGILRSLPVVTRFVLPADRPDDVYTLLASVIGTWEGESVHGSASGGAFDEAGVLEVTGLPFGLLSYAVLAPQGWDKPHEWVRGEAQISERLQVIEVPLPKPVEPITYLDAPLVEVPGKGEEPIDVLLLQGGVIAYGSTLPPTGGQAELPMRFAAGEYVLLARQGDRMARHEFRVPGSGAIRLDLAAAGDDYRSVVVEVVRKGEPVTGAMVSIRGLDIDPADARLAGFAVVTDVSGRAVMRGIPATVERVYFSALDPASGTGQGKDAQLSEPGPVRIEIR